MKLMWSVNTMKSPGRNFWLMPPAAFVSSKSRMPNAASVRMANGHLLHRMAFVKMRASAQNQNRRAAEIAENTIRPRDRSRLVSGKPGILA